MSKRKRILTGLMALLVFYALTAPAAAVDKVDLQPVADVAMNGHTVTWQPKLEYHQLVLTVKRPDGTVDRKIFENHNAPFYHLGEPIDGSYTYELRVIPVTPNRVRRGISETRMIQESPPVQGGFFYVHKGMLVNPKRSTEDLSAAADIVHLDDVIIDGSLCVGNDCYNGYVFGFDTIALLENNLRIFFDDTSVTGSYPRNDWRIICNDHTDGGGNYFAVEDATEVEKIFVLEAGAPSNSLYVDSQGDVGINTATPFYELHIVDGDSPCIRLEQDGSYGWTPQKWDLSGNETNFFIRDATHAFKMPFRIQPDAPTNSIYIKSNGDIGIGTGAPGYALEVERTGANAQIVAERTSGARAVLSGTSSYAFIGSMNNYALRFTANNIWRMQLNTDNSLDMASGAECTAGGDWISASSRDYKENIAQLDNKMAMEAFEKLNPVTYNYKVEPDEKTIGFIAEDVPDLVARNGRKNLSAMEIAALLTKVVQQQQETISQMKKEIETIKKKSQ